VSAWCRACHPKNCLFQTIPVWYTQLALIGGPGWVTYPCHAADEREALEKCRRLFPARRWRVDSICRDVDATRIEIDERGRQ